MTSEEQARIDSVLGGARNPLNWLTRATWLYRSAEVLLEAKREAGQRLWSSSLFGGAIAKVTDEQLREHSRAFEESMGFGMASVLLRGLAIENLLKGILVQRDPEKWVPRPTAADGRLYRWTHNIERLAKLAQIDLDKADARVCRQLTLYIEWGGRYPTAMAPKDHGPEGASWQGQDDELVHTMFQRLRQTLQDAVGLKER
jgi:hypothetical protein